MTYNLKRQDKKMQIQQILENNKVVGIEVSDASRFSDFEQQLIGTPQIRSFKITNSNAGLSCKESIALLQCLATLKNLTTLSLNVDELMTETHNAGQALALLLRVNKLQDLQLYGDVTDSNAFFGPVHEALRAKTSLKHLDVYCQNFGDGIYSDIARIISLKGMKNFKITLDGFNAAPLDTLIGFDELMDSIANISNSTEVNVEAHKYMNHTVNAYNAIMPEQAVRKKLQQRVRENYMGNIHSIFPCIDNYLLSQPDELFEHIMMYVPGLQTVLSIIYPECKNERELMKQFVIDIHRVKCEVLWGNTVREQVLGHSTVRTGLYFDAMRIMNSTNGDSMIDENRIPRREITSTPLIKYKM